MIRGYMTRRRLLFGLVVVLLVSSALLFRWAVNATPTVRDSVVRALNTRFASKVDLSELQVAIFPNPRIDGRGLTLRHNGRTDVPPLITIDSFDASAGMRGLFRTPIHLRDVTLEGLNIHIPVGGLDGQDSNDDEEPRRPNDTPPPAEIMRPQRRHDARPRRGLLVGRDRVLQIEADGVRRTRRRLGNHRRPRRRHEQHAPGHEVRGA